VKPIISNQEWRVRIGQNVEMVLIAAGSGRMLAQAAKNSGLKPLVIDLFADLDTQGYAEDFRQIASLAKQDLAPAVDYFIERYGATYVVYGSGFETYPESLYYLNSRLLILGNHPEIFAKQLDKPAFFSILDELNIPYPEVAFNAPEHAGDWLVKPMQGQGGTGIKRCHRGGEAKEPVYWQRFQPGSSCSVLFLADGQQAQVVGFNSQWLIRLSEVQEFVFSGVANNADLPDKHKAQVAGWLKKMVPVFGLKGLNSLDFIVKDDDCYVLEINPRPSASMQLYDQDLLVRHVQACEGAVGVISAAVKPGTGRMKRSPQSGYQIVYAERDVTIPSQFEWPPWCMDVPKAGDRCRAGQPICSIIAHQNNLQSVAEQLRTKQQLIISKLKGFDRHGIYSQR
jgi:predicted ATP-grasp superfamily ATP-dependent carboligase